MVKLFNNYSSQQRPNLGFRRKNPIKNRNFSQNQNSSFSVVRIDFWFALFCLILLGIGLLFTYSSSAFETSSYFIKQIIFDILGIFIALFLSQTYDKIQRIKIFTPMNLMYVAWILLTIVLFTRTQAHVHRWIDFGFFKFQPSEFAKITLVIYLADYLDKNGGNLKKDIKLLIKPFIVIGITLGLIVIGKDLGTPALMGVVSIAMLFVAGLKLTYIIGLISCGVIGVAALIFQSPYRMARFLSYRNPFANIQGAGYQLVQSQLAIASGGWLGKGLGNSELKLEYLPAAHTDFIFSVVCEEFGFLRVLLIILLFCAILIKGIQLAKLASSNFRSLVILGLTSTICLQAFFNMAMTLGLVPTKGIALPFLSYGGSSIIMTLAMVGIILNMAGNTEKNDEYKNSFQIKNRGR